MVAKVARRAVDRETTRSRPEFDNRAPEVGQDRDERAKSVAERACRASPPSRSAHSEQLAQDDAEVVRGDLHQVALADLNHPADPRAAATAGLAHVSEGALNQLAAGSLQRLAFVGATRRRVL